MNNTITLPRPCKQSLPYVATPMTKNCPMSSKRKYCKEYALETMHKIVQENIVLYYEFQGGDFSFIIEAQQILNNLKWRNGNVNRIFQKFQTK